MMTAPYYFPMVQKQFNDDGRITNFNVDKPTRPHGPHHTNRDTNRERRMTKLDITFQYTTVQHTYTEE